MHRFCISLAQIKSKIDYVFFRQNTYHLGLLAFFKRVTNWKIIWSIKSDLTCGKDAATIKLRSKNNYIEDFTCGVASDNNSDKSWSPIIPNSQLIITPPLKDNNWKIEIFINPTRAMALIIISTVVVLIIIGIIIIIYHVKEKVIFYV